jgi:hypothetical protein
VYLSRGALWAALILTIFSGIDYFVRFYRASDVRTGDVDSLARGDDRWR